ncbi:MAG: hypothetical protein H5T64_04880 [Chloroflexi bacterium]|nr:hypothetical protein [Chloroflexota bacterium]
MRAVFIKQECLLTKPGEGPAQESVEAVRLLSQSGLFSILLDPTHRGPDGDGQSTRELLERLSAGGGRMDAVVYCPHSVEDQCACWGTQPGLLSEAAEQLDLRLPECYLICDQPEDVNLAYTVGCRPVLVLGERTMSDLFGGHQPEIGGFPVARDIRHAADYVLCEEENTRLLGHPYLPPVIAPAERQEAEALVKESALLPRVDVLSPVPRIRRIATGKTTALLQQSARWLAFFVLGGVWLSLGIAYLLTHLYRVQPFPEFVWYLTLQFIPRPLRGLLFILTGVAVVVIAMRGLTRMLNNGRANGGWKSLFGR